MIETKTKKGPMVETRNTTRRRHRDIADTIEVVGNTNHHRSMVTGTAPTPESIRVEAIQASRTVRMMIVNTARAITDIVVAVILLNHGDTLVAANANTDHHRNIVAATAPAPESIRVEASISIVSRTVRIMIANTVASATHMNVTLAIARNTDPADIDTKTAD